MIDDLAGRIPQYYEKSAIAWDRARQASSAGGLVADMRDPALDRGFDGILARDSFYHLTYDGQRQMFRVFAEHPSTGSWLLFNIGRDTEEQLASTRAIRSFTQVCRGQSTKRWQLDPDLGSSATQRIIKRPEDGQLGCVANRPSNLGTDKTKRLMNICGRTLSRLFDGTLGWRL